MSTEKDIRATRRHQILAKRVVQIDLNIKAVTGGRPYVDARLSRHACESEVSWSGSAASSFAPSGVKGRKDRAFYINYVGRIAGKLNQYTTGPEVKRPGADLKHLADTTATGVDIHSFFAKVGSLITASGWCWLHVDRSAPQIDHSTGKPAQRSVAQAEASGDRIWWGVWDALSVVDWRFNGNGGLDWLITESCQYENADPAKEAVERRVRTLWVPGGGARLYLNKEDPSKIDREEEFTISAPIVPFICVGVPSADPHWFDSVENVAASVLNLDSCNHENLLQCVYPQMVIPTGVANAAKDQAGALGTQEAITIIKGLNNPIMEDPQDSGITRYITPPKSELQAIPEEVERRMRSMYQIAGMGLQRDTKQVESAEAKAFDRLDVNAVLAERGRLLQEAETRAVAMSKQLDPAFKEYLPVYPTEFNVSDITGDMEALLGLNAMDLPDGARRETHKAAIGILARVGRIPQERVDELREEADQADLSMGLDTIPDRPSPAQKPSAG